MKTWRHCILVVSILTLTCAMAQGSATVRGDGMLVLVVKARSSPPYDAVFAGFRKLVEEKGLRVRYEVCDAEHLEGGLDRILAGAAAERPDLVFTIGTNVTRSVVEKDLDIPIVYGMVMDTVDLGGTHNATGVILEFATPSHFEWMRRFLPKAKRIGVIYSSENNEARIDQARREARRKGLVLETQEVSSPQDIPLALDRMANDVDVLWGIPDDVVLNPQTAKEILLFCYRNRIPFVGPSEAWVKGGALYALDRDYTDLGMQCGEMAVSLLNGGSPASIGVEVPNKITYFINLKTARHMKVDIDKSLLAKAKGVY